MDFSTKGGVHQIYKGGIQMRDKITRITSLIVLTLILVTFPVSIVSANGETKQLKDLPTGSIVYDPSWTWGSKSC